MKNICNQSFVKDTHRDKKYNGTIKCSCCGEESHWNHPFPFEMKLYMKWLDDFMSLHKNKGCNKKKLPTQRWESTEVSLGIVNL
jgi:transcription elongation factor Elf1